MNKLKKILSFILVTAMLTISFNSIQTVKAHTYSSGYTYSDDYEYYGQFLYSSVSIYQGEYLYNSIYVYDYWDDNAWGDITNIEYSSSNNNVAQFNSSGYIVGKAKGSATLYATIYFDNYYEDVLTLSCTVYVAGPGVILNEGSNISLDIGKTKTLSVKKYALNGATTKFVSSNTSVATVNSSGKVTAKKPGKTTITVSCYLNGVNYTSKCTVTVNKPYLSTTSAYLYKKDTFKLKVYGSSGKAKWKSSNKKVATVKNGKIKAKKKGKATITCKVNGVTLKCKVKVSNPWIVSTTEVTEGHSRQMYVYGHSGKGKWSIKNSSIATISKKGIIKAKKPGTTTVYCKSDGVKLKCKLTVEKNEAKFTPNYTSLEDISYDTVKFSGNSIYFDGNKLKLKGKLFNKTASKLTRLPYASFKLYINSELVLTKELYNQKVDMKSFSTKNITFTLANNSYYKKNIDLNNSSVRIVYDIREY